MNASRCLATVVLAACCLGRAHADSGPEADRAAIAQVVRQFQAAIIAHDGKTLGSLFLQDHDSWLSVLDEKTWAEAKARTPKVDNLRKVHKSSWRDFAAMIQDGRKPVEERFYDVRIDTNGAVASVYFDFDFLSDGKVSNRGAESWQMVRTEDGWKINSMLFSIGR
ncbi:nuclear transport factor 2 family protein [uncultured Massilia sp.]|uniref:nuclear transport factor 2 family protein n=1 Tax=uncultured Massilia sp. TaxID=169973 RepID=UPI0025F431BD|nr:nuclear transport factor 2 family protein [uncultured Massilia sp.]